MPRLVSDCLSPLAPSTSEAIRQQVSPQPIVCDNISITYACKSARRLYEPLNVGARHDMEGNVVPGLFKHSDMFGLASATVQCLKCVYSSLGPVAHERADASMWKYLPLTISADIAASLG